VQREWRVWGELQWKARNSRAPVWFSLGRLLGLSWVKLGEVLWRGAIWSMREVREAAVLVFVRRSLAFSGIWTSVGH
jgi:hypothetical protein